VETDQSIRRTVAPSAAIAINFRSSLKVNRPDLPFPAIPTAQKRKEFSSMPKCLQ
jgi:hypothetical protein